MTRIERLSPVLQRVFTTDAEEVAQATQWYRRCDGKFSAATLSQTLVFGVLEQPQPHLGSWRQAAAGCGVRVSRQGIDQRLNERTALLLERLLERAIGEVVKAERVAMPGVAGFRGIYLQDCSQIRVPAALATTWLGCGNQAGATAMVKLGVRLEVTQGILQGPTLVPGRVHDRQALASLPDLPAKSLRIADLGFFSQSDLAAQDAAGRYVLTRVQHGTTIATTDGTPLCLVSLLRRTRSWPLDRPVLLGAREKLPCRLLAVRVPKAVAAQRRRTIRAEGKRRGQPVDPDRLALAAWTILVTNAPPSLLPATHALALSRIRWQIELLFKGWKSGSRRVDTWRTTDPIKLRCEFFAKLLAAVLEHWLVVMACWDHLDRSLDQARRAVRAFAAALLAALPSPCRLRAVLRDLAARCRTACRIAPRSRHPAAFQLLRDPTLLVGEACAYA